MVWPFSDGDFDFLAEPPDECELPDDCELNEASDFPETGDPGRESDEPDFDFCPRWIPPPPKLRAASMGAAARTVVAPAEITAKKIVRPRISHVRQATECKGGRQEIAEAQAT